MNKKWKEHTLGEDKDYQRYHERYENHDNKYTSRRRTSKRNMEVYSICERVVRFVSVLHPESTPWCGRIAFVEAMNSGSADNDYVCCKQKARGKTAFGKAGSVECQWPIRGSTTGE